MNSTQNFDFEGSKSFAQTLASQFTKRQLVLLSGGLGAGKTQWVQWILEGLGVLETASPTYGIIHQVSQSPNIQHIDLYRLENERDIESVGFWDLFEESEGLYFIEWPERLPMEAYPLDWDTILISLEPTSREKERRVSIVRSPKR